MYIELHARSAFSFLEGASLPEELVAVCAQLNMPAMALLDTDGVYGAPRFHLAAKKQISKRTSAPKSLAPLHSVSSAAEASRMKPLRSRRIPTPSVCQA